MEAEMSAYVFTKDSTPRGTKRSYKNPAEAQFHKAAVDAGYTVTKRGWPDFFCIRDSKICLVEVKPDSKITRKPQGLKRDQELVLRHLASFGVPCYRWTPITGFTKVGT